MWARYEKPNNTCPIAKLVLTFDRLEFVAHGGELLVSSPEDVVWGLGQLPLVQSQMALINNIRPTGFNDATTAEYSLFGTVLISLLYSVQVLIWRFYSAVPNRRGAWICVCGVWEISPKCFT